MALAEAFNKAISEGRLMASISLCSLTSLDDIANLNHLVYTVFFFFFSLGLRCYQ